MFCTVINKIQQLCVEYCVAVTRILLWLETDQMTHPISYCVFVARPRRCPTLSNPVPWQNLMAAYLGYTLRMKTLFRGWPIMVDDTHTRRRRRLTKCIHSCSLISFIFTLIDWIQYFDIKPKEHLLVLARVRTITLSQINAFFLNKILHKSAI